MSRGPALRGKRESGTRIAHISDLHVSRRPALGEINLKRLLGYVNYNLVRRFRHREGDIAATVEALRRDPPGLVLASGDLTQLGLDSELRAAAELLRGLGAEGVPILIAPGNHDCYAGPRPDAFRLLRRKLAIDLAPDSRGVYRLPGVEVVMLDQGVPSPLLCSYGKSPDGFLASMTRMWSEPPAGACRVVCGHFPVAEKWGGKPGYFHGLRDWRETRAFLRRCQVAAYFCGHNHKRFRVDLGDGCVEYAAAALSCAGGVDLYHCDGSGVEYAGTV